MARRVLLLGAVTDVDALALALRDAIRRRRRVWATYHGTRRVLCPHVLGWKDGALRCLFAQVAPPIERGRAPWRCMFVRELEDLSILDEGFEPRADFRGAGDCIDVADCDIRVDVTEGLPAR